MPEEAQSSKAGAPKRLKQKATHGAGGATRSKRPTHAELEARDWHKAGPRRLAGPSLDDGGLQPDAMALRPDQVPPSTDPKGL